MTHRGRNSKQHSLRYRAKRFIVDSAFYDRQQCELVNTVSTLQVLNALTLMLPPDTPIVVGDVPTVECGEVLQDTRGNGSFQKT